MNEIISNYSKIKYCESDNLPNGLNDSLIIQIRNDINNHKVVILKNFFDEIKLKKLKNDYFELFKKSTSSNPFFEENCDNFFRRDIDPPKSAVKRNKQFATSFYWNDNTFGELNLFKQLSRLRNLIANLPLEYTLNGFEPDGYVTYPNISHYPINGGNLNKHTDPPNKQFCTIMAAMSKKQIDFKTGGLYVEKDNVKHYIDDYLEIGDVYLMNPQTIHGVDPIDVNSNENVEWDSIKGRWILFPALIEAKTARGIKVSGLKDLENND
jgi:hypothetical protein